MISECSSCPMIDQSQLQLLQRAPPLSELSHERCWMCSGRADLRNNCCTTAAGREKVKKHERNISAATKVSAGGAPDTEQRLPAAQEKPLVEQDVPLQPMGTTQADLCVQPWRSPWCSSGLRPERATAHGEPPQEHPGPKLQTEGRILQWGRRAGGAATSGEVCGAVPEGWALCYRPMMGLGELQTMGSPHRVSS